MSKILVFGTFDKLNAGHVDFLERSRQLGDELNVLVVEDDFVTKYKGKPPEWPLKARMRRVRSLPFRPKVYQEDIRDSWRSLKTIKPDVIVLSARQAQWRHRLDVLIDEYRLPTRIEILPESLAKTRVTSAVSVTR